MEYFPVFIDLQNKNVLVIGEYKVLEFKINKMIEAGAKIKYLSDFIPEKIEKYINSGKVHLIQDQFDEKYLEDIWLVVCGSHDLELKKKIRKASTDRKLFCNFVDEAPISSFISPSVISKGDITIAISTKGKSPALNKYLKKEIMKTIGDEYSKFLDILGKMRKKVIDKIPGQKRRSELFDKIVQDKTVLNLIKSKNFLKAEELIEEMIDLEINR